MGLAELLVIVLIIMVFFGGSRLPGLARGIGGGIRNFKDAMRQDTKDKPDELEER